MKVLNRHRQGPAKELPTSLFRAPRNRLTPTLLRCRLELTAVSAIVFFLGLLFGFQRPSRCLLPPRLRATVLLRCTPFNLGGCILYFESAFLSSDRCRFASPICLDAVLSRGRGTYFASAFPVNPLRRPFSSARPTFVFRSGEAASTTAASGVNSAR